METPSQRRTRGRQQEIRNLRRYLKQEGQFRETLRRFLEDVYQDPTVHARYERLSLSVHVLSEYIGLVDSERMESGQEFQVIHFHSSHVRKVFPLRGIRSGPAIGIIDSASR
jgi:hypothetical protein